MAVKTGTRGAAKRKTWTKANQRQFLELVAMTGNSRLAARAVGLSDRGARTLRQRDPAFDAAWKRAVDEGYDQVEEQLLSRALGKDEDGGGERRGGGFDPALALKVLQMRGANGRGGAGKATPLAEATGQEALDAKLLERLDALAERLARRA